MSASHSIQRAFPNNPIEWLNRLEQDAYLFSETEICDWKNVLQNSDVTDAQTEEFWHLWSARLRDDSGKAPWERLVLSKPAIGATELKNIFGSH